MAYLPKRDSDEQFEKTALLELQRLPVTAWPQMLGLWGSLNNKLPATRKRILAKAVKICAQKHQPPPAVLVEALCAILVDTSPKRGATVSWSKAAWLLASDRNMTDADLARRVRVTKPAIATWRRDKRFKALLSETTARRNFRVAHNVLEKYVEKFGLTFEWARDPTCVALGNIVPLMESALAGGPQVTTEMVDALRRE